MEGTTQLLERWRRGDDGAVAELLRTHLGTVREMARQRLGRELRGKLDSDDIAQEAIAEFLRYGPRFVPADSQQLQALLARIVVNTICDQGKWFQAARRRMVREQPLGTTLHGALPTPTVDPAAAAAQADLECRLRLAMELLDERDRQLLVWRDWQRLSFAAIAAQLACSDEGARGAWRRAVGRLRARMADLRTGGLGGALAASEQPPDPDA